MQFARIRQLAIVGVLVAVSCGEKQPVLVDTRPGDLVVVVVEPPAGFVRAVATVTGPGMEGMTRELATTFHPLAASGTIVNVPSGADRQVVVEAFPAAPDGDVVIFRGRTTTEVIPGGVVTMSVHLLPVVADVAVTAWFPPGDPDAAEVRNASVVVSGQRLTPALDATLVPNAFDSFHIAASAIGSVSSVPVGHARLFSVKAFGDNGLKLFAGDVTADVAEGSAEVRVSLHRVNEAGSEAADPQFCKPDCAGRVCGRDGCGGSCGGCGGGLTCSDSGSCVTPGRRYTYSVVAGNGTMGFSGDNGPATEAQLNRYMADAVMDAFGNLFISDAGNGRIRKVDSQGIITTYAGKSSSPPDLPGNGGPATQATLNAPAGLTVDPSGNLYFAEFNGNGIRKVDTSGIITQYATFSSRPTGLTIDTAGNLYASLYSLNQILKISPTHVVTVFAGTGTYGYSGDGGPAVAARLRAANAVWADHHGNVFIDDTESYVIRKVNSAGIITTVAGSGVQGYSGDNGPALQANISSSGGVAADDAGNIYIPDSTNNVIRMVDTSGIIHTIAGSGDWNFTQHPCDARSAGFNQPGDISIDAQGNIYVVDNNTSVYKLAPVTE
jgi:sugar lactone lactonase YvrE